MSLLGWDPPELAALDAWVDEQLVPVPTCRSRVRYGDGRTQECRLPAGHQGLCEWAREQVA